MAGTASGNLKLTASFAQTLTGWYNSLKRSLVGGVAMTLANGTAADQIDLVGVGSWSITAGGSQDVDLTSALVDSNGAAVNFARVKFVLVQVTTASNTDGSLVTFKAGASNGNTNIVSSGGILIAASTASNPAWLALGYANTTAAVVDSTHKVITFAANGTAAVTVNLMVAGCSV